MFERHHQEMARALFEEVNDAVFVFDPESEQITDANPMAQRLSGHQRSDLLQMRLTDLLTAPAEEGMRRLLESSRVTTLFHSQEGFRLRQRDGGEIEINVSVSRVHLRPHPQALLIVRDITDQRLVERALRVRNRHLEVLNRVAHLTTGSLTPEEMCDRLLSVVRDAMPCDAFTLDSYSEELDSTQGIASYDTIDGVLQRVACEEVPLESGSRLRAVVIQGRRPLLIHRENLEIESQPYVPFGDAGRPSASLLWAPLVVGNHVVGVLSVQSYAPHAYTDDDVGLLEAIAHQVGPALEAATLSTQLRQSQHMLASFMEGATDAFTIWDQDLGLLDLNQTALDLFPGGGERERVIGTPLGAVLPEERRDQRLREFRDVIRTGIPLIYEEHAVYPVIGDRHLSVRAFRVSGGLGVIVSDVTEQRRAEEKMSRLATAVEQATEAIIITDTHATILYVNPAFEKVTGHTRGASLGRGIEMLKCDRQSETFYEGVRRTFERGEAWSGRFLNRRPDGKPYEVEATITPIRDGEGRVINFVAVQRDVTKETQLEDQLRHSQKMEAIGQLAGGIAHDFNNLLMGILGYCDLALEDLPDTETVAEYLEEVRRASEQAATLTRQLLTFGRRQVLRPINLDLNDLVADLMKMVQRLIGEDIDLQIMPGANLWPICADPSQLEQVIVNLCVNARDAMPEGGKLIIETENVTLSDESAEWGMDTARFVVLTVRDTGVGMDPETVRHIFEPFFTTKEMGRGTGLGLATVYGIVKQHDGMIRVDSHLGLGTTFTISFPVATSRAPEDVGDETSSSQPRGGSETILLAEDEPMVRSLAERILRRAGYTVLSAPDGSVAVELFESHADAIDLAVLDVVMPRLDGHSVADRILATRPAVRVLFTSGYSADATRSREIERRGYQLLAKPYEPNTLLSKVREVLDRSPLGYIART
ncbi:PAS domain S-box protein [Candidatus Sumerlaeota bacterium]|nr:PAS domain S-box protein [Candidatus Sumerlaeota bacterium]